jgi:hypothetical protein
MPVTGSTTVAYAAGGCEHVLDGVARVVPGLLRAGVRVLATSRERLAVTGERVLAVDPPGQGLTEVTDPAFRYDTDAVADSSPPDWIDREPPGQLSEQRYGAPVVENSLVSNQPADIQLLELFQSNARKDLSVRVEGYMNGHLEKNKQGHNN